MMFEISGSSADYMPKRKLSRRLKDLNPIWFVRTSLMFMKGHRKSHVWLQMIPAYVRYARICLSK